MPKYLLLCIFGVLFLNPYGAGLQSDTGFNWKFLHDITIDTQRPVSVSIAATFDDTVYVAWEEQTDINILRWEGRWTSIDKPLQIPLPHFVGISNLNLISMPGGQLFLGWLQFNLETQRSELYVARRADGTWSVIGNGPINQLPLDNSDFVTGDIFVYRLMAVEEDLYIAWIEYDANAIPHVFVQRWQDDTLQPPQQIDENTWSPTRTLQETAPSRIAGGHDPDDFLALSQSSEGLPIVAWVEQDRTESEPGIHIRRQNAERWEDVEIPIHTDRQVIGLYYHPPDRSTYLSLATNRAIRKLFYMAPDDQEWVEHELPATMSMNVVTTEVHFLSLGKELNVVWLNNNEELSIARWDNENWTLMRSTTVDNMEEPRVFAATTNIAGDRAYIAWIETGKIRVATWSN